MRFAKYLHAHAVDEWRRAYINYRLLKKQIGKAEAELLALDDEEGEKKRAAASGPEGRAGNGGHAPAAGTSQERRRRHEGEGERDLERGRDEDEDEDADTEAARKTSRSSAPASPVSPRHSINPPLASPGMSHISSASRDHSDESHGTSRPLVRDQSQQSRRSHRSPILPQMSRLSRQRSSEEKQERPRGPNRRWRDDLSPAMELEEIYAKIPTQCRKFFTLLDKELDRVSGFYADREAETVKRYEDLSAQWKELANHKKEFQAFRANELHAPAFVSSLLPKHAHLPPVPGTNLVRRTLAKRRHQNEEAARRLSDSSSESRDRQNGQERTGNGKNLVFVHERPEEYTNARSKLKLATFEYYRLLGMLKSYRVLNRTGFAKALKKYEKITAIPCAAKYIQKVEAANFVASEKLEELIRETEDAFAEVFERGDRKKALERLRDFGQKKRHHFTSWRAGMLMGAGLPLMIEGLVLSFKTPTRAEIPYWNALLQLFGACFLPVFFSIGFFLNLAAWSQARINYVLIFELDVRNRLDYHQFIELPALLYFILSLFFWAAFSNFWPNDIQPSAYPLAWIVVMLVIMLNPLPILYPSTRWWMLRSFARMITSGLVAVEFRDFFLGDEMNSLYYSLYNLGFLYCVYDKGWPADSFTVCSTNRTWTSAILACLPPFWRLGQSIRRYLDSDGVHLHLLNAGKYLGTMAYFFAYFSWRIHKSNGEEETWRFALFVVFATLNTCYTSTWDILMDWSLVHRDVKDPKQRYLRKELAFFKDAPWLYWVACVVNVLLRFSWVIYFTDKPPGILSYAIALAEAARRLMWNVIRVEAEHVGNRDGYRVTRDVSLPYVTASSPEATGALVEDSTDDHLNRNQRFFASVHTLHSSILRNFRPLIEVFRSAPLLSLGRRVDPAAREAREVDVSEEERDERKKKKKIAQGKVMGKRKRHATLGGGEDSSSEPEGEGDTTPEDEEEEEEEGGQTDGSPSASPAVSGSSSSRQDSGGGGTSTSKAGSLTDVEGQRTPATPPPPPSSSHLARAPEPSVGAGDPKSAVEDAEDLELEEQERHEEDEREDDRRLEEGMAEVEEITRGLAGREM
ncbi:hypothetical protein JCM11641_006165 [Rhodosporidiobolus odoratus]